MELALWITMANVYLVHCLPALKLDFFGQTTILPITAWGEWEVGGWGSEGLGLLASNRVNKVVRDNFWKHTSSTF